MTEESRRQFKELLRKKDFESLETLWLELVESETEASGFFELTDLMLKTGFRDQATTFLSVLISERKQKNDFTGALEALKRLAQLNPDDRYIRREMIGMYQEIYQDNPRIAGYISKSELGDKRPITEAAQFLENCLLFDPGSRVFDNDLGMGRVTELDLMVDKLVVDFGQDKPVSFHLSAAFKHLTPLPQDHFLSRKQEEPDKLSALAQQQPLEVLRLVLRSFARALKPREIKEYLGGIVPEAEWDSFWSSVLKAVADDPNIRALTKPERTYQWVPGPAAQPAEEPTAQAGPAETPVSSEQPAEEVQPALESTVPVETPAAAAQARKRTPKPRARARKTEKPPAPPVEAPAQAVTGDLGLEGPVPGGGPEAERPAPEPPCEEAPAAAGGPEIRNPEAESENQGVEPAPAPAPKTLEDFADALRNDTPPDRMKETLAEARDALPDEWPALFHRVFLQTSEKRVWATIVRELSGRMPALESLAQETTTYFNKYPAQFLYLARNAAKHSLKLEARTVVSRVFDLLDSDRYKPYWSEARSLLAEGEDALLKESFQSLSPEDAEKWFLRLDRIAGFEDFRKDELRKLFQSIHTHVVSPDAEAEDVIFSTKEGIDRKEIELRQLLDVEIPKSSEDIGKAREFGDLSENYEYKVAKERQARLLARVAQIQRDLKIARPIDFEKIDTGRVSIGTRVIVEEMPSGERQEFTILGPWDIDPDRGVISHQAPFAQRLLGKKVGDFIPVNPSLPSGKGHRILEIVKVS